MQANEKPSKIRSVLLANQLQEKLEGIFAQGLPALSQLRAKRFDLAQTLHSGQVFHWHPLGSGYLGLIGNCPVFVQQNGGTLYLTQGEESLVQHYFALDHPIEQIHASFPGDECLSAALAACVGLRIIRQPLWECLATFITSSMKQVAHIRQISLTLRKEYGQAVFREDFGDFPLYSYPTPESIARLTEDELRQTARLGYRAKTLLATARQVSEGHCDLESIRALPYAEAHRALCTLPGVGEKVANCVLLFAYERLEAFPVDVWIERALRENYFPSGGTASDIRKFAASYFGCYGGYAQQVLFHYHRTHAKKGRAKFARAPSRDAAA